MTSRLEIKNSLRPKVKKSLAFEYNETMIKLIPVIVVELDRAKNQILGMPPKTRLKVLKVAKLVS